MPRWSKLTRKVRDIKEDVTLRTKDEAIEYMVALPRYREMSRQWQICAGLVQEGCTAERMTDAVELALFYDARLDVVLSQSQKTRKGPAPPKGHRAI